MTEEERQRELEEELINILLNHLATMPEDEQERRLAAIEYRLGIRKPS